MALRVFASLLGTALALASSAACSSTATPAESDAAVPSDAGGADTSTVPTDAGARSDADAAPACSGACRTLSLDATYGAKKAGFQRAQFGWDKKGATVSGVTVEIHAGGAPECPKQSSPTPDRTLIVSSIPVGSESRVLGTADGIAVTLLDFKEALTTKPLDKATSVKLTVVALEGEPPQNVAFDLEATFEEGTIKGHVFAEHCTSMDE